MGRIGINAPWRRWLSIYFFFIYLLALSACAKETTVNPYDDIPDIIYNFIIDYLEAAKDGYNAVVEMDYYPSDMEFIRESIRLSKEYVIDYRIESAERINDNLYGFVLLVKTDATLNQYLRVANFVAYIDGQLYRIPNVSYIPNSLQGDIDLSEYSAGRLNQDIEQGKDSDILFYEEVKPEDVLGEMLLN